MNRAERRRQERKASTGNPFRVPVVLNVVDTKNVSNSTGLKLGQLEAWADIQREEQRRAFVKDFNSKLEQAEDFIGLANILISVKAINLTWGYKKAVKNYIDNLNKAHEIISQMGVRTAFKKLNEEYGLDLEFDSFEIEDFIKDCGKLNIVSNDAWRTILRELRFSEKKIEDGMAVFDRSGNRIFEYDNEVDKARLYDIFTGALWGKEHGIK